MEVVTFKINHVIVCVCETHWLQWWPSIYCFSVLSVVTAGSRNKMFTKGLSKMTEGWREAPSRDNCRRLKWNLLWRPLESGGLEGRCWAPPVSSSLQQLAPDLLGASVRPNAHQLPFCSRLPAVFSRAHLWWPEARGISGRPDPKFITQQWAWLPTLHS